MLRGCTRNWKTVLACLMLASLLVTTTVVLGHDHGPGNDRNCDVCHFGHMAWTGSCAPLAFVPEVIEEWGHAAEPKQHQQECVVSNASSRAPPVFIQLPA